MSFYVSWSGKVIQPFNQWCRCLLILGDNHNMVLMISIWYLFKYMITWIVWNPFNGDDIDVSSGNLVFAENWRLEGFWGGFDEKSIQAGTLVFASKSFEAAKSFGSKSFHEISKYQTWLFCIRAFSSKCFPLPFWKYFPFSWTCEKPVWRRYPTKNKNVVSFF